MAAATRRGHHSRGDGGAPSPRQEVKRIQAHGPLQRDDSCPSWYRRVVGSDAWRNDQRNDKDPLTSAVGPPESEPRRPDSSRRIQKDRLNDHSDNQGARMTAGRPLVYASMQGPAANTSWLSSRVWARWSEALAHRSRPSTSTSMIPAASASNSCLAAMTAW